MQTRVVKSKQHKCSPPTEHAMKLHAALTTVGVEASLEHQDGHKCVDIFVPKAKLYIEVDGRHHYISAKQIATDFARDYHSDDDGFHTMHITNEAVENDAIRIARAIKKITNF